MQQGRSPPQAIASADLERAAQPSDIQIESGICDPSSHIAEGPIGSDLTKRQSRFYCNSAVPLPFVASASAGWVGGFNDPSALPFGSQYLTQNTVGGDHVP
jgi:hypothetical protein